MDKFNIESIITLEEYKGKLVGKIYKLLPLREEKKDWQSYLDGLLIELIGAKDLFGDSYELGIVLANLNGLRITNTAFHLYRKIVLDSISIVKKGGAV